MHVSFKIHYRNNLIDIKDSYLIPRPPSWFDRYCSYGHQLYPSDKGERINVTENLMDNQEWTIQRGNIGHTTQTEAEESKNEYSTDY